MEANFAPLPRMSMEPKAKPLSTPVRWALAIVLVVVVVVLPIVRHRWVYEETRRLRVVVPGTLYRSGRMTANGMEKAIVEHKIRTVINLMDEDTDPVMNASYFGGGRVKEKELCEQFGVKYLFLQVDTVARPQADKVRPKALDEFLALMKDPKNHPVLLHCRAGLHRTGVLVAAYRIEIDGWSPSRAWDELRANGFGEHNCYVDNDYIKQYVFTTVGRSAQ
jgi:protein-tyrosine phosphatase